MSQSRIFIALGLAILTLSGLSLGKAREETRLRDRIAGLEACQGALGKADLTASAEHCPPPLAAVHVAARRQAGCDHALLAGDLFALRTICSTEVKTLFAQREAETRRADNLADILKTERADRAADIARAEARARTETERKLRAQAAISSAPRDGDLLVLDAGLLCQLRGESADCAAAP